MRCILAINPNSSASVTAAIDAAVKPLRLSAMVEPTRQAVAAAAGAVLLQENKKIKAGSASFEKEAKLFDR